MPFAEAGAGAQRIFYAGHGSRPAGGAPLLFIHGAGGNHLVWGRQLTALGQGRRALALDLPGHGRSDPPGRASIAGYRDAVLDLLDSLDIENAFIIGHSMGGAIALSLALGAPGRVAGLILLSTGARLRVAPAILEGVAAEPGKTAALVIENSYSTGLSPGFRERALAEFLACPVQVTQGDFAALDAFDCSSRLREIAVPTLVLCGREDRMTPFKYSEFLAKNIPGARLSAIEGSGHSVMLERPDEVNAAISAFMSSL